MNFFEEPGSARRRPASLAIVLTAFALWLLAAPTAQAARSEFFGIVQGPRLDAQDLQEMRDARIRTDLMVLVWPQVQPIQGSFDWAQSDLMVGNLASRGIRPVPRLYGSPDWIGNGAITRPPIDSAADEQAWGDFLKAAVARYGPGGSYWANEYPQQFGVDAVPLPIRSWQIWNEPNVGYWFSPEPSPQEYAELLGISHDAIKSQDPQAQIVLAGLFSESPSPVTPSAFLDDLYQIPGARDDFDAAALHPYGCNLDQVRDVITNVRAVMKNRGDGATPLWLTEFGWASGTSNEFCRNKGLEGQRDLLVSSYNLILENRANWNVQRLFWFIWRDPAPGSPYANLCRMCGAGGLVNYDRSPKPAYEAFTGFTAETTPPVASITGGPRSGGLTKDPTPTFSFASNEAGSTFRCHFDARAFMPCASPRILGAPLSNGTHTFYVHAIDVPGNESTVVSRSFTIDTGAPAAPRITDTDPNSPSNVNASRVKGQAEAGSTVRLFKTAGCTGAPVAAGSAAQFRSPGFSAWVADNSTTFFRATARDAAGNVSACSAARAYVEDTTSPQTTITGGPSGSTVDDTPTFTFSSSETGSTFRCRFDSDPFAACSGPGASHTPSSPLFLGTHTFEVRATDRAKNTDPTPATRTFSILF